MADAPVSQLALVLPRVLIVSRRTVRKNKLVDFVGEYHLDLIVKYGAVPVIVPRVAGVHLLLDSFEPIHGVLLCEGEDIDPSLYHNNDSDAPSLSAEELEEIRALHSSDTAIDKAKDSIELLLAKRCLERNIPYLGICRGSQVLNVACGGSLYQDVEKELSKNSEARVKHMNYENYDGHRHSVEILPNTPLHEWFRDSLTENSMEILVNSYHHQGVKRLADRFKPMAYATDGLMEAFYDPDSYNPEEGKFIMGLQFHPERMRHNHEDDNPPSSAGDVSENEFDYPGCACAYREFVKAVLAYQKKLTSSNREEGQGVKLNREMEKQRKRLVRSFSIAKLIYDDKAENVVQSADLETGAMFLESSVKRTLSHGIIEQFAEEHVVDDDGDGERRRLKQMGATVRNSAAYTVAESLKKLPARQLWDLLEYYKMILNVGSHVLSEKLASF